MAAITINRYIKDKVAEQTKELMPTIRYDEDNDGIVDVAMKIGNTTESEIVKNNDIIDCGTF